MGLNNVYKAINRSGKSMAKKMVSDAKSGKAPAKKAAAKPKKSK